ncbi:MAG: PDZ domain-containing protein [Lachnospiraceae bacterium]|jgi:serine protease Do|nr:PDZ domain-containing protein [Lachnospiraceae bacterium]
MYENEIYSNSENGGYTSYQTSYNTGNIGGTGSAGNSAEGKKKKGTFRKFVVSMGLGITFGAFAGAGFYAVKIGADRLLPAGAQEEIVSENQQSLPANAGSLANVSQVTYVSGDISGVVEQVMPAMVSIVNNYTRTTSFWGYTYSETLPAAGSGIIIGENETELLIATNNHVVDSADSLEVTFIDGTTAAANIKGVDAEMDLAVIAVQLESLSEETRNATTIAKLGDSDSLKLGEPVIAIGNALGYGQSVTNGIISALDREVTNEDGITGTFIQTNAAINGGNSGGALLTITGEVIGINSSKIRGTGVEGMGYAIPINSASPIISDLMEHKTRTDKVADEEKGYMGIYPQNVTAEMSQLFGIPEGVYVADVFEGTVAETAGIKKGDVIVKFDGNRITSYAGLQEVMQYFKVGDTVKVTVKRVENGEYVSHEMEITLGERPED